jgi:predicted Zn-dependent protease
MPHLNIPTNMERGARMSCGCGAFSRRRFLAIGGAAVVLPLSGCDDGEWPVDLVSDDTVREMGLAEWRQMKEQTALSTHSAFQAGLDEVGARMLTAMGENPADWELQVFKGDAVNAFALPGNKIGVFEGMMGYVDSPAELAAVVGHEIGHHSADHAQQRMNAAVAKDFGLGAIEFILDIGDVAYAREISALLGLGVDVGLTLPYTREHELEADILGLRFMAEAGYDPQAAVNLWRRMAVQDKGSFIFLSTHPAPADRAERLERLLRKA